MNTDIKWQVPHMPTDIELLAALGRVSIRHGFLDLILKRTVKTLADLTVQEADKALAYEGSSALRDLVKKLAIRRLGKASQATLKLTSILADCQRVTERRNSLTHAVWGRELDGEPMLIRHDSTSPVPTADELNALAEEIDSVSRQLNQCRFPGGFLQDALAKGAGAKAIETVRTSA